MAQSRTKTRVASRNMIKALGLAGAISTALVAPNATELIDSVLKYRDKKNAGRTFTYLKYRNLIEVKEKNGQQYFKLTSKGRDRFERIMLDDLKIPKPKKRDQKWRMVIFDIPTNKNSQRKYLLHQLRTMNFYLLQNSVWIHPFDCSKQVGVLINYLGLEQHVSLAVVESGNFTEHATKVYKDAHILI